MTQGRYERMSDHLMREKSPEDKRVEMVRNLELCFQHDRPERIRVTSSVNGRERVRGYIPDEDAYAGWIENSSYIGIVKAEEEDKTKYLAERHYPHQPGKPTYLWEFTPDTGELYMVRRDGDEMTEQLDVPLAADAEQQGYFLALTQEMTSAHFHRDFDKWPFKIPYTFELEDLQ